MARNYLGLGHKGSSNLGTEMKPAGSHSVNTSKISDQTAGTGSAGMGMTKVGGGGINKGGKAPTTGIGGGSPQNAGCSKSLTKVAGDTLANKAKGGK